MTTVYFRKGIVFVVIVLMVMVGIVTSEIGEENVKIEFNIINGPPFPDEDISELIVKNFSKSAVILSNVPTSRWTQGCSATSAGMIFGYYDLTGYSNMYNGPANDGVCPLSELGQGKPGDAGYPFDGSCSIIATAQGYDGRMAKGHTDDFWISYLSTGPDPWETYGWTEHTWGNCTADFMGTNQWKWDFDLNGNRDTIVDGGTVIWTYSNNLKLYDYLPPSSYGLPQTALAHGMRLFVESRGYTVSYSDGNYQVYSQKTDNQVDGGFSFDDFKNEIDNGFPVMVQVYQHSMVGVGYDDSTNEIYIHDTWGNYVSSMSWGGSYSGRELQAITVIHLDPPGNIPPVADFSYNPTSPTTSDTVYFNDLSTDADGIISNWTWDFGDGNTSFEQNPTHQYASHGNYTVCLTVKDDDGAIDSICKIVHISTVEVSVNISLTEEWNLISIPVSDSINKNDIKVNYSGVNHSWQDAVDDGVIIGFIYDWNETEQNYEFTDALEPGQGYWVYAYSACDLWASVSENDGDHIADLTTDWNLVGLPYDEPVAKDNLTIYYSGTNYSWQDAVDSSIIIGFIYNWNETGQNYEFTDILNPGEGYWMYAYYNCTLFRPES